MPPPPPPLLVLAASGREPDPRVTLRPLRSLGPCHMSSSPELSSPADPSMALLGPSSTWAGRGELSVWEEAAVTTALRSAEGGRPLGIAEEEERGGAEEAGSLAEPSEDEASSEPAAAAVAGFSSSQSASLERFLPRPSHVSNNDRTTAIVSKRTRGSHFYRLEHAVTVSLSLEPA